MSFTVEIHRTHLLRYVHRYSTGKFNVQNSSISDYIAVDFYHHIKPFYIGNGRKQGARLRFITFPHEFV